jgi:hypothetical protein
MGQKSQMVKRRGTDNRPLAAMLGELRELRKLVQMTERSFKEVGSKDPGCGAPARIRKRFETTRRPRINSQPRDQA